MRLPNRGATLEMDWPLLFGCCRKAAESTTRAAIATAERMVFIAEFSTKRDSCVRWLLVEFVIFVGSAMSLQSYKPSHLLLLAANNDSACVSLAESKRQKVADSLMQVSALSTKLLAYMNFESFRE